MAKYEIDMKVLPGLGAGGHIDRELGQCKPGEVIEATAAQARVRSWLKPVEEKKKSGSSGGSKKKSSKQKAAAEESEAANAKE